MVVEYFKLDKVFVQGTTYSMPADRFYVIRAIGTNATSPVWLKIDGVDTGKIISDVAPLHETTSNLLGPMNLGNLFYVVPPQKTFTVEGPSGAKMRCIGLIGKLAPGEGLPGDLAGRFTEQGKHYWTYDTASVQLAAAGGSWAKDAETEVYSRTPKTIEEITFNNVVMASLANTATAPAEGDVAVRFFLDGSPLDILTTEPGKKGVDLYSMPKPPAGTTEMVPFTLADKPIRVLGDHTISIKAVNTSGAAISASSTAAMTFAVWAIIEYAMKG